MKKIRAFLSAAGVGLALLAASSSHSNAQLIPDQCKFYFSGKADVPRSVESLMQGHHDSTAEACLDRGILHRYTSITDVFRGSFDVCSYFKYEQRIFDDRGNDITTQYNSRGTQMLMAVAGPNCPPQDDPRYILAGGVSEGVFAQLKAFADQLALSPQNFDAALAADAKQIDCGRDTREPPRFPPEFREREYQNLREGIADKNARSRFRLWAIDLRPGGEVFQGGYVLRGCSGYSLNFSDPINGGVNWILDVEFTPAGLKIVGLTMTIA